MRTILVLGLLVGSCAAQSDLRNRLTFSGGWSREVGGYRTAKRTGTGLGLSYGYRFHRYIEAEAGAFTALQPSPDIRGATYFWDPDDRFIWVPLGIRFIAPLDLKRLELSAGGGGLYQQYWVSNPNVGFGLESRHGWGGYLVASTALALDRSRHFWLGVTPRLFLANPAYSRDRWFQWTGEFSFRF